VHQAASPYNLAAKYLGDGLMAQADAENRYLAMKMADKVAALAGFVWSTRAGGNYQMRRLALSFDSFRRRYIVAENAYLLEKLALAKLANALDEVVGKAVVIVQYNDHGKDTIGPKPTGQYGFE